MRVPEVGGVERWKSMLLTPKGYGYEAVPPQVRADARRQFAGAAGQGVKGFASAFINAHE